MFAIAVRSLSRLIFGYPHCKFLNCAYWWLVMVDKSYMWPCRTLFMEAME